MGGVLSDYNAGSSLGRRCVIVIIVSNCGAEVLATNWATPSVSSIHRISVAIDH